MFKSLSTHLKMVLIIWMDGWMDFNFLYVLQLPLLRSRGLSHEQDLCSTNLRFHPELEPNWTGC